MLIKYASPGCIINFYIQPLNSLPYFSSRLNLTSFSCCLIQKLKSWFRTIQLIIFNYWYKKWSAWEGRLTLLELSGLQKHWVYSDCTEWCVLYLINHLWWQRLAADTFILVAMKNHVNVIFWKCKLGKWRLQFSSGRSYSNSGTEVIILNSSTLTEQSHFVNLHYFTSF